MRTASDDWTETSERGGGGYIKWRWGLVLENAGDERTDGWRRTGMR